MPPSVSFLAQHTGRLKKPGRCRCAFVRCFSLSSIYVFCQRCFTTTLPCRGFVSSPPGSLAVDLYPLALHVSLCDASGRPNGRERLVLTSHHVHVRDMLMSLSDSSRMHGLSRGLSVTAIPTTHEVGVYLSCLWLRVCKHSMLRRVFFFG